MEQGVLVPGDLHCSTRGGSVSSSAWGWGKGSEGRQEMKVSKSVNLVEERVLFGAGAHASVRADWGPQRFC